MNDNIIDLLAQDIDQDVESLPEGNALGSWASASSASSTSCPLSSASSVTTASSYG
ncbi:thiocillin family RiPP [Actinomyces sp.]|uniref:thiocillin family RiPP n=1 Tax=Actinomyces sp. TaxID=29317 RepID=UPI0026DCDB82|nr:thiocillin family RiPP [Actinomyces sp.]MDO4900392.1 thiocillin family RiPP [Actinomyces sp.]